jgi:hypothetical protein
VLPAIIGAVVGAVAVLPVAFLKYRLDRSKAAATLDVAKRWFVDRYEEINHFDGQFLRLLHAIEHVRGDRPSDSRDRDDYYLKGAYGMCREMRDRARAQVGTVGLEFVSSIEAATDAAAAWLDELAYYCNSLELRRSQLPEDQRTRLDGLEGDYWLADEHRLKVRRELLEQKVPPALKA